MCIQRTAKVGKFLYSEGIYLGIKVQLVGLANIPQRWDSFHRFVFQPEFKKVTETKISQHEFFTSSSLKYFSILQNSKKALQNYRK